MKVPVIPTRVGQPPSDSGERAAGRFSNVRRPTFSKLGVNQSSALLYLATHAVPLQTHGRAFAVPFAGLLWGCLFGRAAPLAPLVQGHRCLAQSYIGIPNATWVLTTRGR